MMVMLLVSETVVAQHVNFGIKGGLNLSNISQENNESFDQKVGYHFGILTHIHVTDQFALQPEIVYSVQGTKYNVGNIETKLNLDYVNVPVLLQYMFDNGFRLQAGPQVGFLNKASARTGDVNNSVKDSFEPIEIGIAMGIGYVNPPTGFGFDLRYNAGLTDINKGSEEAYNRGFQVGVFYLFKHN